MSGRLAQLFQDFNHHLYHGRVFILGVGNPERSDDGLGTSLAQRLISHPNLRSIACDEMPENHTGEVKDFHPTLVILLDAVDFKGYPGDVLVLETADLQDDRFSSHKPSLALLMGYLHEETDADVILLGVQPAERGYRESLSPIIEESVCRLSELFERFALSIEKEKN